jgi:hypothetical protein
MGSFHTFVCDVCGAEEKSPDTWEGRWLLPYTWSLVLVGMDRGVKAAERAARGSTVCSRSCGARLLRAYSLIEAGEGNPRESSELEQALKLAG